MCICWWMNCMNSRMHGATIKEANIGVLRLRLITKTWRFIANASAQLRVRELGTRWQLHASAVLLEYLWVSLQVCFLPVNLLCLKRCTAKFSFQVCIYTLVNTFAYCRKSDVTQFIAVDLSSVFLSEILSVSVFSYSLSDYLLRAAFIKIAVFLRRYFVLHCLPPINKR